MNTENNYYKANILKPFHCSVGIIPVNENKEVLVHYYERKNELDNVYWLGHKTLIPNQSLENVCKICLEEEFGGTGEIITFLCSRDSKAIWWGEINKPTEVTKTTLYFLMKLYYFDTKKLSENSPEYISTKKLVNIEDLIKYNLEQHERLPEYCRGEFDESFPLKLAKNYIDKS